MIVVLQATIVELQAKIAELERRLHQDSHNSSRPPSSDPPGTARPHRELSGRKPGAQPGHPAHQRDLVPPDQVGKLITAKPEHCRRCNRHLDGDDPTPVRHQVFEILSIRIGVIEVQLHSLACPDCGAITQAALPPGIPRGMLGPRLVAMMAALTGSYHVSRRNAASILRDFFKVSISLGSVSAYEEVVSEAIAEPVAEAQEFVQKQAVVNVDETSWREKNGRAWLWVAVTVWVCVFLVQAHRSAQAARKLLGSFAGILGSDRAKCYGRYPLELRQLCWAHLLRAFEAFAECKEPVGEIGRALLAEGRQMFKWWHKVRDGTLPRTMFQRNMEPLERRVEDLLEQAACGPDPKVAGTCVEILSVKDALWTFVDHEGVEPTNNESEREVRQGVIWRKMSLGSQSQRGSRYAERMLTVSATLRRQSRNVVDYLTDAIRAAQLHERPPSLLPSADLLATASSTV